MSKKLTPWFPPDVKPVRVGHYEAVDGHLNESHYYCLWNGTDWHYGHLDLKGASTFQHSPHRWSQWQKELKQWRGLAKEPK